VKPLAQFVVLLIALLGIIFLSSKLIPSSQSGNSSHWQQIVSNWYWVEAYGSWVEKDKERLLDNYGFATALDPGNLTYWRLATQTIAYDFPVWDIEEQRMTDELKIAALRKQYGEEALQFFSRSKSYFDTDPTWYLSGSFIAEQACLDSEKALQFLEAAITLPDFSFLTAVNFTRLLIQNGRSTDALQFLKEWYPTLIEGSDKSRHSEVSDWIKRLESGIIQPTSSQ